VIVQDCEESFGGRGLAQGCAEGFVHEFAGKAGEDPQMLLAAVVRGSGQEHQDVHRLAVQGAPVQALAQAQDLGGNCGASVIPAVDQTPYYNLVGECGAVLITESQARMTYNSAQVTLRQRTHHGLEYTLNYTFAKSLTDSSGNYAVSVTSFNGSSHQDGYNIEADYGPSAMDVRHSLNFVGVYELPFGRGRTYGANANGFLDAALGGWRLATTAVLYSGLPVTIFGPGNSNTNSWGFSRANQYRQMTIRNRSLANWWGTDPSAQPCVPDPANPTGAYNGTCAYGVAASEVWGRSSMSLIMFYWNWANPYTLLMRTN